MIFYLLIDKKELILKNTKMFINNQSSNNILLWGASGMGNHFSKMCDKKINEKIKKN